MTSHIRLLTTILVYHLLALRRPPADPDRGLETGGDSGSETGLVVGRMPGGGQSGLRRRVRGDAGYTTETVIVTALLLAAGITVLAIVTAKIVAKANQLDFG